MAENPKLSFRVETRASEALRRRMDFDDSISDIARICVERYLGLLPLALPTFTEEEALCICQALNGILVVEPRTAQYLYASVQTEYRLGGLNTEGVDIPALVERLAHLSIFECMAVHDAVEQFWRSAHYKQFEVGERLRQIGLVKADEPST